MLHCVWYLFVKYLAATMMVVFFRLRVHRRDRVPAGGVLLVSNHQSYLDPIVASVGLNRIVSFMARRTLFRNLLFGWFIRSIDAFPVSREGRDTSAVREAVRRMKSGKALLVFPEGTRTRDGSVGRMRGGMDMLVRRAGVPLVPVAIDGAFEAWPPGGTGMKLAPIRVAYGAALPPEQIARMSRNELQERVRNEIVGLLREMRSDKS